MVISPKKNNMSDGGGVANGLASFKRICPVSPVLPIWRDMDEAGLTLTRRRCFLLLAILVIRLHNSCHFEFSFMYPRWRVAVAMVTFACTVSHENVVYFGSDMFRNSSI